jgi:O-antigen/teichoic acid export membrane protein
VISAKLALGVAAVGVVTLAENIASFTQRVDGLVSGSLYPAICAVKDRLELMYESLVKSNRLALMWAAPFGLGLTLFSADLVRYGIGERWHPAIVVLEVYGVTAAVSHVGFNWDSYFRALGMTRPIATVNLLATAVFVFAGVPLVVLAGLPGFAIGIALQALAALLLRAYYLQRLFPAFDFLKHAARAFLPTVPGVAAVLLVRAALPHGRTLGAALAELAIYVAVTALATWRFEASLLREAVDHALDRRQAAAA